MSGEFEIVEPGGVLAQHDLRRACREMNELVVGYAEAKAAITKRRDEDAQKLRAVGIDPAAVVFNYEVVLAQVLVAEASKW